jgi:hypothetical protein
MRIFDFVKPRTAKGEARKRERELMTMLEKLMAIGDEATFREGLQKEFGIKPDDPRFKAILDVWRGSE